MNQISNLSVFGKNNVQLIHNASCYFPANRLTLVGGISGAGKTVLLETIMRRTSKYYTTGSISIEPSSVTFVPVENYFYEKSFSIMDEMIFVYELWYKKIPTENAIIEIYQLLHSMELYENRNTRISSLSTGQKKRLSVARALLNPHLKILILDEPTSNLDSATAIACINTIKQTCRRMSEVAIICTLHQPSESLLSLVDYIVLLHQGRVLFNGILDHVYTFLADHSSTVSTFETLMLTLLDDKDPANGPFKLLMNEPTNFHSTTHRQSSRLLLNIKGSSGFILSGLIQADSKQRKSFILNTLSKFRTLFTRQFRVKVCDPRKELLRFLSIQLGNIIICLYIGRIDFNQTDFFNVLAILKGFILFQNLTTVSISMESEMAHKVYKTDIDNGVISNFLYMSISFSLIVLSSFIHSTTYFVVSWWLGVTINMYAFFTILVYFMFADVLAFFILKMVGNAASASLITLFIFLATIMTEFNTVVNPIFVFFGYYYPTIIESIRWMPCSIGVCFGGENGCDIISTMTAYECNQPFGLSLGVCFGWIIFFYILISLKNTIEINFYCH